MRHYLARISGKLRALQPANLLTSCYLSVAPDVCYRNSTATHTSKTTHVLGFTIIMTPNMPPDVRLMLELSKGSLKGVDAALRAGASVDGDAGLEIRPLMICAGLGNAKMAKFLVERGADLEIKTTTDSPVGDGGVKIPIGSRAIHTAVSSNAVEVVRVLIDAGADVTTGNSEGRTPLMAACSLNTDTKRGPMVSLLLEAGADCTSCDDGGVLALHSAAFAGDARMVDLLLSKAPSTLNHACHMSLTPLYVAAQFGHAHVVKQLLSAGATNQEVWNQQACPLRVATDQGHDDVVRVLLTRRGLKAIRGASAISDSITTAALQGRARIVHLLVGAGEEEERWQRANGWANGFSMLHDASAGGHLATVSVLLAAGADERQLGTNGMSVADVAQSHLPVEERSPKQSEAVRRLLARGPAFRAWSWAWPKGGPAAATGGAATDAAAAAADGGVIRASGNEAKGPLGVRVFLGEKGIQHLSLLVER